ncbi:GspH/FimT family pseudopilin [Polaromonas sp. YR568]|uniref:GspH/FimT family pseudopilin n=1 Tax=Polaromonas sp. YR568 TaxID=1855301 RepID=UPI00398C1614
MPPRGFTLIELLVVMAIIAIFASFAIPSFRGLIASASVSSAVNAFIADTRYARGEAMRRGKSVTICRSANAAATAPACSSGDGKAVGGWMEGWVVFVDDNDDNSFDTGETVLRIQEPLTGLSDFLAVGKTSVPPAPVNSRNYIAYDATGRAVGLAGRWLVHASGTLSTDHTYTRTLCMNFVGRVRTQPGEVICP